ncbi:hypothetical protein DDW13_01785 [Acidianus hospitalis]|uniref:Uncharacterized protein n=1 Tax=Acidianus hospitalis TaxID=563177 RepID=A0A2T9XA39_9CREN|nr:hypothetical protein DDW13_01785 [Acidianus hospitalis]
MASGTAEVDEYVFVPLVNDVNYEYNKQTQILTLKKGDTSISIKIGSGEHISKTEGKRSRNNNKYVEIHNILVLTGYAIDEDSLGLVQTLDPCDYVKGILINGEIASLAGLSKQEITLSKAEVMNKLYFIRKSNVNLKNNIKINLITESKPVRKTNYRSLKIDNKNEMEEFKNKIKGIIDLYDIQNSEDINNLVEKLSDIINYYSI